MGQMSRKPIGPDRIKEEAMHPISSRRTAGFHLFAVALVALTLTAPLFAQTPRPGEVQRLHAITLSLRAGSTDRESKRVTYTPPPGWYVRSHHIHCAKKTGLSSFSVSTVPQDWGWSSEEKVEESYKALIELAEKAGDQALQAKFVLEQKKAMGELRKVRSTHHALVLDATAKGEGFLRGGGILELTVTAELVFVGTNEGLDEMVARIRRSLSSSTCRRPRRRRGRSRPRRPSRNRRFPLPRLVE
jgi:hypothetical protein